MGKNGIWKNCSFLKLAVGTMGSMNTIPKNQKKVDFATNNGFPKLTVGTMVAMGGMPKSFKKGEI